MCKLKLFALDLGPVLCMQAIFQSYMLSWLAYCGNELSCLMAIAFIIILALFW